MTDSSERSVFLTRTSIQIRDTLASVLADCDASLTHFARIEDCRELLRTRSCDLLVVDLDGDTEHGLQLLAELEQTLPRIPKLAFVDHGSVPVAIQAIRAGAANCLERPVEREQLLTVIRDLLDQADPSTHRMELALTPTETTVLRFIMEGRTNHETAHALHRSPRTIEVHRRNIMRKSGASSMADLVESTMKRSSHRNGSSLLASIFLEGNT